MTQQQSLFATTVQIQLETASMVKLILACTAIFVAFFLIKKLFY